MPSLLKILAVRILPYRLVAVLRRWRQQSAGAEFRNDEVAYPVQDHVELRVYWKALAIGKGPAIAFYVYTHEVLRFDCFGEGAGHWHYWSGKDFLYQHQRLYFPERSTAEQVERSFFELEHNLAFFLERHRDRRVRRIDIDPIQLTGVLRQLEAQILKYAHRFADAATHNPAA